MLVGERAQLSPTTWQVLQATGTSHLMAISGLHIGMIATLVGFVALRLWRCGGSLCLVAPAPLVGYSAGLIAAVFYSGLAGFTLPTQRALMMFSVLVMAFICRRRWSLLQGLYIALWCVLLFDPLVTLTIGFWLSFTAVAAISYAVAGYRSPSRLWQLTRAQLAVSVLLGPLTLWFFSQLSLVSLLANAIAIPWIGWVVLPIGFCGLIISSLSPALGQWCLHVSATLLHYLWQYLTWLSYIKHIQWIHPITHVGVLFSAMIGVLLLLAPRGWPMRWLGVLWLLPVYYFPLSTAPAYGAVAFTLLDVGQGLASVIRTQHHTLLYDTGLRYGNVSNSGDSVIIPYLHQQGITSISRIVLSHADSDHSGGLAAIVNAFPVDDVISSEPAQLSIDSHRCQTGQQWQWDGVRFRVLAPPTDTAQLTHWRDNDKSCVLRIQTASTSLLLTGDIEHKTEDYLVESQPEQLASDVLIVPHHGSRTSSTESFISAVSPKLALFPVGYHNRFGFPHAEVLERYQAKHVQTTLSWRCGALTLQLDGSPQQWQPHCWRAEHPVFWQDLPKDGVFVTRYPETND